MGARAQPQGAAWLQRPHNDGRQGMPSRQYSSRKTDRMRRDRLVSIDVTALRSAPSHLSDRKIWSAPPAIYGSGYQRPRQRTTSHSSGRRNRSISMAVHRGGHQRVGTKSILGRSSATTKIPAERRGSQSRFPFALQGLLPRDFRFRILVVGKRECGKSSLIRTIFKADMSRSPINVSGRTAEFRPLDNPHLIVHECLASGPGEMQAIRDFITTRNHKSRPDSERLHVVWICIPVEDVIYGQVDEGVKILLDIGVPFVIVFTKFDLFVPNVSSSRDDYEERCRSLFGKVPAEIVSTKTKFRELINRLVATTDGVIIAHSRNVSAPSEAQRSQLRLSPVSLAWSVSQRASRSINVQAAIEVGQSKYWRGLWSGDDFRGQTLASCIKVIHADIVGVWNLPNKDRYLSSKDFREEISYLVQDLSGSASTTSRPKTGPAWLTNHHGNSKENICLVVGYIIDLLLILCRVFSSRNVSPGEVQSAINNFAGSSLKTSIHKDISSFITTVPQFQYHDNDVIIAKITDLTLRNCDPPWSNAHVSMTPLMQVNR
ncbi:hypothetical protein BGY98DRAFT_736516 [Russula aff. rugulosa BPL654]|nr:hypothetical protein BGY98DRAFT_736516 [Russula aff. rugulosa BPL654]